ncbi:hypothetical protein B7463_g2381, partial [Scytalidium lignicola]
MIAQTQFDIIWVQYYNTPQCSARNWASANPNYLSTGIEQLNGFSHDIWANFLVGTASANAKLHIGLPRATTTKDLRTDFYLNVTEMSGLVKASATAPYRNSSSTCLPATGTITTTSPTSKPTTTGNTTISWPPSTTSPPPVVITPTPIQPGMTTNRDSFHLVTSMLGI